MTNVTFSKAERKQINLRFNTLYKVVTAKTWTKGAMGRELGEEGERYDQDDLRDMGKAGKTCPPKGLKMCLAGAAAWVNGPTEEQICALLATQIVISMAPKALNNVMEYMDERPAAFEGMARTKSMAALVLYEEFLSHVDDQNGEAFDGEVGMNDYGGSAVGVIIRYNDPPKRKLSQVRAMIKKAQALYDKLAKVKEAEDQWAVKLKGRDADFAKLSKLF